MVDKLKRHHEFIQSVTLNKILDQMKKWTLIDICFSSTLVEAFLLLKKHNIRAIPVFNTVKTTSKINKCYVDIIRISDIIKWLFEFKGKKIKSSTVSDVLSWKKSHPSFLWRYPNFNNVSIVIHPFLNQQNFVLVNKYDLETFEFDGLSLVTQLDVFNYFYYNIEMHSEAFLDQLLADFSLGSASHFDQSFSVKSSQSTADCFKTMLFYNYDSLLVLEEEKIKANISASDLIGINLNDIEHLNQINIIDFLKKKSPDGKLKPVIEVTPKSTMREIMKLFYENRVHQIWVSDEMGNLINQISLAQFLEMLCLYPFKCEENKF